MEQTLYHAVNINDTEKLRELIVNGADVDEVYTDFQNISTKSVLHICCEKGRVECAQILVDAGAFLDINDKWGQTPLMYCMTVQYPEIARILLEKDPDLVYHRDVYGKSPLHCSSECDSVEGIQLLLEYGADINIQNNAGLTPLMTCVLSNNVEDHVKMVKVLLNAHPDINKKDYRSKRTVLQHAVLSRRIKLVEMFIEAGADVNTMDGSGKTPLTNVMSEYIKPHTDFADIDPDVMAIIVMLLQAGADINLTVCEPSNAFITAVFLQIEPLVRFFICEGADVNVKFATTVTPLIAAVSKYNLPIIRTLLEWNVDIYPQSRIYKKCTDMEYMYDSCQLALDQGRFEVVRLLIGAGYHFSSARQAYLYPDSVHAPPKRRRYGDLDSYLWNNEGQMDAVVPEGLSQHPEMLEWVKEQARTPRSLMSFAVIAVRRALGREVTARVLALPVPSRMKDQVLLKDVLHQL